MVVRVKRITAYEPVEFSDDSYTERGERVWKTLRIDFPFSNVNRVLTCDKGIGITEEFIEDTIKGCLEALQKDFPLETFSVTRVKPNHIRFDQAGWRTIQ